MLLLKASHHPNWRATVECMEADTAMLMPGFVGIGLLRGSAKCGSYTIQGIRGWRSELWDC